MNEIENALLVVDEELGELATECLAMQKRIKKVQRFSADEVEPGSLLNNAERVNEEFNDLLGAVSNLRAKGFPIVYSAVAICDKLNEIGKFEQHSRDNGTIQD